MVRIPQDSRKLIASQYLDKYLNCLQFFLNPIGVEPFPNRRFSMHLRRNRGKSHLVKKSFKIARLSLLIASPFVLLGAVFTQFDPFMSSSFRQVKVKLGSVVETIPCDGEIWYHHVAYIKPPNSGRTEKVNVIAGQKVKSGDELMTFTTSEGAELLDVAKNRKSPHFKEMRDVFKPVTLLTYFTGQIIEVAASKGSSFTSDDNLFVIADEMMANVQVAETSMPKIHIGQKATVTINSMPDQPITAHIKEVPLEGYEPSDGVVLYTLVMKPDSLPEGARIGMSTNASIEVDRRDNVIYVPDTAITIENGATYVRAAGFGWSTEQRQVQLGLDNGSVVEVKSGLKVGDVVMVPRTQDGDDEDLSKEIEDTVGSDPLLADHSDKPKSDSKSDSSSSKSEKSSNGSTNSTTKAKQTSSSKRAFGPHASGGGSRRG